MLKTVRNIIKEDYVNEQEYMKKAKTGQKAEKNNLIRTYYKYTMIEYFIAILPLFYIASGVNLKLETILGSLLTNIISVIMFAVSVVLAIRQFIILNNIVFKYYVLRDEIVSELDGE